MFRFKFTTLFMLCFALIGITLIYTLDPMSTVTDVLKYGAMFSFIGTLPGLIVDGHGGEE